MSDADGGLAAEVSKPGNCSRDVYLGDHEYVFRHSWRPHTLGGGVQLTTTPLDSKGRPANTKTVYTDKTYLALSFKGEEMAEVVLKNKRDWWNRQQVRQPTGRSSSSKKRRTADSNTFCPIITALRGGTITRPRRATADKPIKQEKEVGWRQQSAETFLASMDSMGTDAALKFLDSKGLKVAADIRREVRDLKAKAKVGVALEGAIKVSKKQNKTSEGQRTWQTLLTAAAFCRPANDDQEAKEEEKPTLMSNKRMAAALGVREAGWSSAVKRAKQLQADLHPREAIEKGVYWFWPRAKRSDATSEELMELMRQYWHDDEVSRKTGNSGDREMWKESKSPTAHRHPRRQLTEPGGGDAVYAKFLKWANYRSFKSQQGDDFVDPGRTLFLSTRCKCLTS